MVLITAALSNTADGEPTKIISPRSTVPCPLCGNHRRSNTCVQTVPWPCLHPWGIQPTVGDSYKSLHIKCESATPAGRLCGFAAWFLAVLGGTG